MQLIHSTKAKSRDIIPVAINPCKNQPMAGINATHHGTNGTNMHTKTVITIIGIHSYLNNILIKVMFKHICASLGNKGQKALSCSGA